jgi:competence CoiA-like predicted nuclease
VDLMLTCQVGKTIVDTFTYEESRLREWSNKGVLRCPACGEKILYCHGDFKIPYFRHEKNSNCPDIYSEGVTEEHIQGIKILYDWLNNQKDIENLQLEKWIPETRQRPDIYFIKDGQEYVIEFQCSPIATQYNKRHDLYRLQEIKDIWILGLDKYSINNLEETNLLNNVKFKTIEIENYNINNKIIYLNTTTNEILSIDKLDYLWRDKNYRYQVIMKTTFNANISTSNLKDVSVAQLTDYPIKTESIINSINSKVNYLNNLCGSKKYTVCRRCSNTSWVGILRDYGYSQLVDEFNSNMFSIDVINNSKGIQNEIHNIELENFIRGEKGNNDTKKLVDNLNNYVKNIDPLYEVKINYISRSIYYELRFNKFRVFDKNILEEYKKGLNTLEKYIIKDFNDHINNIKLLKNRNKKIKYINKLEKNIKEIKPIGKYKYKVSLYIRDLNEENIKMVLYSNKNHIISIFNNYILYDEVEIEYNEDNFNNILENIITNEIRNERYGR